MSYRHTAAVSLDPAIQLMKLHGENGIKRWKEEVNYGKRYVY
ncbi:hypothetical protein N500_0778 [Wolbachia pipientis wUni]|nr:hypothetical protein N500_0778 [Wolbachia pipientis wUni]